MKRYFNKRELTNLNYKTASLRYGRKLMHELPDSFDWNAISEDAWETKLTPDFVEEFADRLVWNDDFIDYIASHEAFTEEFIEKHIDRIYNLNRLLYSRFVSEEFLEKYYEILDKLVISTTQKLSNSFLRKHHKDLFLDRVSYAEPVDRETFKEISGKGFDWNNESLKFDGDFSDTDYLVILKCYPIHEYGLGYLLSQIKFPEYILKDYIRGAVDFSLVMDSQFMTEKFFWKMWKKYRKNFKFDKLPEKLSYHTRNICFTENWSKKFRKEFDKHNLKVEKRLAKKSK